MPLEAIRKRLEHSYFGPFTLSILILNYQIVLIVLGDISPFEKIKAIKKYDSSFLKLFTSILFPFVYSFLAELLSNANYWISIFVKTFQISISKNLEHKKRVIEEKSTQSFRATEIIISRLRYIREQSAPFGLNQQFSSYSDNEKIKYFNQFNEHMTDIFTNLKEV